MGFHRFYFLFTLRLVEIPFYNSGVKFLEEMFRKLIKLKFFNLKWVKDKDKD